MRATFAMLESLTLAPNQLTPDDVAAVRATGVSEAGIVDLLYIAFLLNAVNRVANGLDYEWEIEATARKIAAILNRMGYRLPGFLLR
jgi:alkylhydroperoxidase family enzyme